MRYNHVPIVWPRQGVSEGGPYSADPGQAAAVRADHVLNVRNFDKIGKRNRGGQRPGLSKAVDATVNGSNAVQMLGAQTTVVALNQTAGVGTKFANPSTLPT